MKTFSATDARNKFGDFLDSGMVEGARIVRNNRILGYFVPEREYERLKQAASGASPHAAEAAVKQLTPAQKGALVLYSQGKITSTEAKAELGCDRRGLIALVARHGFLLPHVDGARADEMAHAALGFIVPRNMDRPQEGPAIRKRDRLHG